MMKIGNESVDQETASPAIATRVARYATIFGVPAYEIWDKRDQYAQYGCVFDASLSAFDSIVVDTDRDFPEYAKCMGISEDALSSFMSGQRVLDVGSGLAIFACESILRCHLGLLPKGVVSIDSLNSKYAAGDYFIYARRNDQWLRAISNFVKLCEQNGLSREAGITLVERAKREAEERFLGLNWEDVSSIPDQSYTRIISCLGFPHYADQSVQLARDGGMYIKLGERGISTLTGFCRILAPGGEMLLNDYGFTYEQWTANPKAVMDIRKKLARSGYTCSIEILPGYEVDIDRVGAVLHVVRLS